ncbi:MAG: dephospho-CoA kinase [Pelagibacterales bacterium MED-G40]|nr:MAG: dephospho-CoA kinase [Candidatus Pelagibacter sp. TMED203]PDH20283.1 MAG: dephospho-CoA kinase [Pelagibacterales bacterium MED-G40]|tara:strand:- start:5232 stop:5789 length:558 start_codon:yes stop_codon:yes gene_type:complete
MINIGITGTLSSGKSTVAKLISGGKYSVFSADKSVKNLYTKKYFIKKIQKKFNIKNAKGIKQKIKSIIKNDKKKLKELELVVHPLVRKEMRVFLKKKGKIKIFEIPLLIENKLNKYFDLIVNIAAKKELRLRRYLRRGGNKKIFTILDNRQFKNKKKIKNCDYVIYNNKSFKSLKKQVNKLKKRL